MQPFPDARFLPVPQASPAGRATATAQLLGEQPPRAAGAEDEDDAPEGGTIRDTRATAFGFGRLFG